MSYLYDPVKKTVTYKDEVVPFYCGPELNDTTVILLDFYFQRINLQETFIRLMTVNEIAKNVSYPITSNDDDELAEAIEKQISFIRNGGHFGMFPIQEANRLIHLMGGDIIFTADKSKMVDYYLMLLLIKKGLS